MKFLPVHSIVSLSVALNTFDSSTGLLRELPAGTIGTIVHVYKDDDGNVTGYDLEVVKPFPCLVYVEDDVIED